MRIRAIPAAIALALGLALAGCSTTSPDSPTASATHHVVAVPGDPITGDVPDDHAMALIKELQQLGYTTVNPEPMLTTDNITWVWQDGPRTIHVVLSTAASGDWRIEDMSFVSSTPHAWCAPVIRGNAMTIEEFLAHSRTLKKTMSRDAGARVADLWVRCMS